MGRIDGDDWSIEVNIGDEEDCKGFAFHVRGGDAAIGLIAAVLEHLDLRAVDSQSGDFFMAGQQAITSFHAWRAYRDQVVPQSAAFAGIMHANSLNKRNWISKLKSKILPSGSRPKK